jgi:membrane protein YqaA with SNARE-associated domain
MLYFVVFLASLGTDLIPVIGPPVWTVMVFMLVKYDLNPWIILAVGVPGSTLGRYLLSLYVPLIFHKVVKQRKNDELAFVGQKLGGKLWRSWLFVLLYSLLPLSTTALFSAAGMAKIRPIQIIPPFFVGKFISDAVMLFSGRYAIVNSASFLYGTFSFKGISCAVIGLAVVAAFLFVDWFALLEREKLKFNFRIWR